MYFNLLDFFCNKVKLGYSKKYFVFRKHPVHDLEAPGGCPGISGRPGIDPMKNIICLPCMSKYRFIRVRISNHMSKI
jgi:hypothetical protein